MVFGPVFFQERLRRLAVPAQVLDVALCSVAVVAAFSPTPRFSR